MLPGSESGRGINLMLGTTKVPTITSTCYQLELTSEKAPALKFLDNASTADSIRAGSCNQFLVNKISLEQNMSFNM